MKVNMWKKWRRDDDKKKDEVKMSHRQNQEEWLEKLEKTLDKMKKEVEEKRKAKELYEEKRKKLLAEKKQKQEQLLRQNQEKKERREKKKQLEERWAMARWVTQYIDENEKRWASERKERKQTEKQRAEEWKRLERFEKIRVLKEKMQENKTVTIKLNAPKLTLDQAEHLSKTHSLPVSSQVDQETNHDDLESNHRDAPDLADHHPSITSLQDITTSSSITNPELAIQSTTTGGLSQVG